MLPSVGHDNTLHCLDQLTVQFCTVHHFVVDDDGLL